MATRGAQQALVPGRVVLMRHPASGLSELGVICGAPAGGGRSMGLATSSGSSTAAGAFLCDACVVSVPHRRGSKVCVGCASRTAAHNRHGRGVGHMGQNCAVPSLLNWAILPVPYRIVSATPIRAVLSLPDHAVAPLPHQMRTLIQI